MRAIWNQNIFETEWLYTELYAVILLIILINVVYFSWGLLESKKYEEPLRAGIQGKVNYTGWGKKSIIAESAIIDVTQGERKILLKQDAIERINLVDGYSYVQTCSGETYVSSRSLDDFSKMLEPTEFFRANRQHIVNRNVCASYRKMENGKIQLLLNIQPEESIVISQRKAREFRRWILRKNDHNTSV